MSITTTKLPSRGSRISARDMRDIIRATRESAQESKGRVRVTTKAQARAVLLEIKILNLANLTCIPAGQSANPSAPEYTIELPQTFNEAARQGVTYSYSNINTRVADGTENQQLTPNYVVGDLIVVQNIGTFWIDMNIDGRQWAKVA